MESIKYFTVGLLSGTLTVGTLFCLIHGIQTFTMKGIALVIVAFILSIPIHELIHGITCAYVSDNNYKTIHYGVNFKKFYAYCRYTRIMDRNANIYTSVMPGIVLGVIPAIIAILIGNPPVCAFAILSLAGASKDIKDCYDKTNL